MIERKEISVFEHAPYLLKQLRKGALLNVSADGKDNTMTIGWGTIGIEWGQDVFVVYVRDSRYSYDLLERSDDFTLSFPLPDQDVRKILAYCGTKSGRDVDKFEDCHLDRIKALDVKAPAILQLPLTIECEIIYRKKQTPEQMDREAHDRFYPQRDYHTAYYGRIKKAYILKEE